MQPLRAIEMSPRQWPRDLSVLGIWFFSLLVFSSFKTPGLFVWSGSAFVVLYAAWAWTFWKACILLLLVSWVYASIALTPSGLYWLTLMAAFLVTYLAQFRVMIRNVGQFMLVVFLLSFGIELFQMFLVSQLYPGRVVSGPLFASVVFSGGLHAVVALLIYPSVQRWVVSEI